MPIETEIPRSNRDRIYDNIDRKAGIVSDLWRTATILPPLLSDSPEFVDAESRVLRGIVDRARGKMPDAFEVYDRYQMLDTAMDSLSSSVDPEEEQMLEIQAEMDEIKSTVPDLDFAKGVVEGVEALVKRRADLRQMQEIVGEPLPNGIYKDMSGFKGIKGIPEDAFSSITRVYMGAYSVNIFMHDKKYDELYAESYPNTLGIHLGSPNSLLSVVRDHLGDYVQLGWISPEDFDNGLSSTILHEEFHGFADSFDFRSTDFGRIQGLLKSQVILLQKAIDEHDFRLAGTLSNQIRANLKIIPDASMEEILAEMASTQDRDSIPSSTFAYHDRGKRQLLDSVSAHSAMVHVDVEKEAGKLVDILELQHAIGWIYHLTDHEIPERRSEVDALFAIFPPSKIRHIRRVVERWTSAKYKAA